jgi:hypothetical protein
MSAALMVLALGALNALTACGTENPTMTSTPEIRSALDDVDDAIVDENHRVASQALKELKRLVIDAHADGVLSDERSDAILSAANELLRELGVATSDEPETSIVSPPTSEGELDEDDGKEVKPDKSKGHDKPDKSKGHDKPDKPDEPDEGPGNSEGAPGHEDD